jgi:hypothetical protein
MVFPIVFPMIFRLEDVPMIQRPGSKATSCCGPLVQLEASMPTRAQRLAAEPSDAAVGRKTVGKNHGNSMV